MMKNYKNKANKVSSLYLRDTVGVPTCDPCIQLGSQYGTHVYSWGPNMGPMYTVGVPIWDPCIQLGPQYGTHVYSWGPNMGPMYTVGVPI